MSAWGSTRAYHHSIAAYEWGWLRTKIHNDKPASTFPRNGGTALWKTCWFHITAIRTDKRDSLSHKTLGHNAELPPSVLNQVAILGHHHVVELFPFLCDHHVGVTLHSEFETYEVKKTKSDPCRFVPLATSRLCTLKKAEDKRFAQLTPEMKRVNILVGFHNSKHKVDVTVVLEGTNEPLLGQTGGVLVQWRCNDAGNSAQQLDSATDPDVNLGHDWFKGRKRLPGQYDGDLCVPPDYYPSIVHYNMRGSIVRTAASTLVTSTCCLKNFGSPLWCILTQFHFTAFP